jgi:hypothetical protein
MFSGTLIGYIAVINRRTTTEVIPIKRGLELQKRIRHAAQPLITSKMAIWILQLLFASVAVAHFGVESIIADGTTYV